MSREALEPNEAENELARWHVICDEEGLPHDPELLVQHHRANAGLAGYATAMSDLLDRPALEAKVAEAFLRETEMTGPEVAARIALDAIFGEEAKPECRECDTNRHLCPGCGEDVEHGETACQSCKGRSLAEWQNTNMGEGMRS